MISTAAKRDARDFRRSPIIAITPEPVSGSGDRAGEEG
jgi:hypothetical protein